MISSLVDARLHPRPCLHVDRATTRSSSRRRSQLNLVSTCMCATTTSEKTIDSGIVDVVSQAAVPKTRCFMFASRASGMDRRRDEDVQFLKLTTLVNRIAEPERCLVSATQGKTPNRRQAFPLEIVCIVSEFWARPVCQVHDIVDIPERENGQHSLRPIRPDGAETVTD